MKRKYFWMIIVLIVFVILLVIAGIVFSFFNNADEVSSTEVSFEAMELTDTSFTAEGIFTSSGMSFRKYEYTVEGDTLSISVFGGLVNNKYPNGDFKIAIQGQLENITKVCLDEIGRAHV